MRSLDGYTLSQLDSSPHGIRIDTSITEGLEKSPGQDMSQGGRIHDVGLEAEAYLIGHGRPSYGVWYSVVIHEAW